MKSYHVHIMVSGKGVHRFALEDRHPIFRFHDVREGVQEAVQFEGLLDKLLRGRRRG